MPRTCSFMSAPAGVSTGQRRADAQVVVFGVVLGHERAVFAELAGHRLRSVLPLDVDDPADVRGDAGDARFLAERRAAAGAHPGDDLHAGHAAQRFRGGRRDRREVVRGGERVVGVEQLVDRALEGRLQPGGEHRHERHEREPDHQRRRRRGGARRGCAWRWRARAARRCRRACVAGQPSTEASGGTSVFASIATPRNSASAPTPIASRRCAVDSELTNRPTSISATADRDRQRARRRARSARSATAAARAPSRTAAIGGTRVARIAGPQRGEHGDHDADEQRDDDRPRREHRRGLRQVDAERDEQRVQPLRERRARGTARRPTRAGRSRRLRAAPSAAPGGGWRRACAASPARACAGRS